MTVVIADTSPINYLLLIGEIAILPRLYGQILIPPEVLAELSDADAPPGILQWVRSHPAWLETRNVRTVHDDAALGQLDPGERAAILLAQQETGALLLIDDAAGRSEATRRGISSTGTLGILRAAAVRQLLNLPTSLKNLAATNFRVSQRLIVELLEEDTARKRRLDP
jgi:predicted nucleic acid-binding protein